MISDIFRSSLVIKSVKAGTVFKVTNSRKSTISRILLITDDKTFAEELIKLKEVALMDETYNWKFTFSKEDIFNITARGKFFQITSNEQPSIQPT